MGMRSIFVSNASDAARSRLNDFFQGLSALPLLRQYASFPEMSYEVIAMAEAHSRKTLMPLAPVDILALTYADFHEDSGVVGLPEITVCLDAVDGKLILRVTGSRNIGVAAALHDSAEILPVCIAFDGPQSLPSTGVFSLMTDGELPEFVAGQHAAGEDDIMVRLPSPLVSARNLGLDGEVVRDIAATLDGIISVYSQSPVHERSLGLEATERGIDWASKKEERGEWLSVMPQSELFFRAAALVERKGLDLPPPSLQKRPRGAGLKKIWSS